MKAENPLFLKIDPHHINAFNTYYMNALRVQNFQFGVIMDDRLKIQQMDFANDVKFLPDLIQALRDKKFARIYSTKTKTKELQLNLDVHGRGSMITQDFLESFLLPVVNEKGRNNLLKRLKNGQTIILAPDGLRPPKPVILEFKRR